MVICDPRRIAAHSSLDTVIVHIDAHYLEFFFSGRKVKKGWRARELMAPLFMGDDEELQMLIRTHIILLYLF